MILFNHSCTFNSVCAWVAWSLSLIGAVLYAGLSQQFGVFAVLFAAVGATLHVRGFIYSLERSLEHREVTAFNLGRESVRIVR